MSVCTLPPGGVSPGASRWSAAPADDGAAFWVRSIARTIAPARASSIASPSVLLFINLAEVMCLLPSLVCPGPKCLWFARRANSVRRDTEIEPAGRRARTQSDEQAESPRGTCGGDARRDG